MRIVRNGPCDARIANRTELYKRSRYSFVDRAAALRGERQLRQLISELNADCDKSTGPNTVQ